MKKVLRLCGFFCVILAMVMTPVGDILILQDVCVAEAAKAKHPKIKMSKKSKIIYEGSGNSLYSKCQVSNPKIKYFSDRFELSVVIKALEGGESSYTRAYYQIFDSDDVVVFECCFQDQINIGTKKRESAVFKYKGANLKKNQTYKLKFVNHGYNPTEDKENDKSDNETSGSLNNEDNSWTYSEATTLNGYCENGHKYAQKAMDYMNKANAIMVDESSEKNLYTKYAIEYMGETLRYMNSAKALSESKAELTTNTGKTMTGAIEEAISSYDNLSTYENTTGGYDYKAITDMASNGMKKCYAAHDLSVKLLAAFK